jgi:hypothetical protein
MIFANRLVRTRMLGGVGAGGENPPATRLVINIITYSNHGHRSILLCPRDSLSRILGISNLTLLLPFYIDHLQ